MVNLNVFLDTYAEPKFLNDRLSIFHKIVVAAFITFVTFFVFAEICILLSQKLLQLLLLTVDLTIAFPFNITCSQRHLEISTCTKLFGKGKRYCMSGATGGLACLEPREVLHV